MLTKIVKITKKFSYVFKKKTLPYLVLLNFVFLYIGEEFKRISFYLNVGGFNEKNHYVVNVRVQFVICFRV